MSRVGSGGSPPRKVHTRVKESFEPQTEDDAEADVSFQEAVLSASTIRMPHPIRSPDGSILGLAGGRQIQLLVAPENLQNCHRDLVADNVLPMGPGGVCVIDWENCGLEDPSHELAVVIFDSTTGTPGPRERTA